MFYVNNNNNNKTFKIKTEIFNLKGLIEKKNRCIINIIIKIADFLQKSKLIHIYLPSLEFVAGFFFFFVSMTSTLTSSKPFSANN